MFSVLNSKPVKSNFSQGSYSSKFFELQDNNISRVEFNNYLYKDEEIERTLLMQQYSFAYLREDKLRTISTFDSEGKKIEFAEFLRYFSLFIKSSNIFKTGKYLSRVFRPVKYGLFYKGLDIHLNNNPKTSAKNTDGISLISLELAKSLGWKSVKVNSSAQFTLLYKDGLVKGNCIVSDMIEHDVVIYGDDNIKKDISLTNETAYISLEPLKLSDSLRIDIQSVLNLWEIFGGEQYLNWAYAGMLQFKKDLISGDLITWFNDDEDPETETWTLKKAIYSNIDYRRFPGLLRQAWSMFRKSLIRYAYEKNGELNLRIPVPGGLRGYIRVDLRNHDADGNFISTTKRGTVTLDALGNLWIHEDDITEFMEVKGGADQDDSVAIIPVEGGHAVIYRNPNQYGEYGIHMINYDGIKVSANNKLIGKIPYKKVVKGNAEANSVRTGNDLLDMFLKSLPATNEKPINYDVVALLRSYNHIKESNSSIGLAANAEMLLSAIRISNHALADDFNKLFNWNLEKIIDSQVKDGISADADMAAVRNLLSHIYYNRVTIPKNLFSRFPEKMRSDLESSEDHPFDELIHAIKYLINKTDVEILGRGSAKKGNRIPGIIDSLDIPVQEIGLSNLNNPMKDLAGALLTWYNRTVAIMLERTKHLSELEKERILGENLEKIQSDLLKELRIYDDEERNLLIKSWAYKIYSSERAPHDSILWIGDKEENKGTAADTICILIKILNESNPKSNPSINIRKSQCLLSNQLRIRLWSNNEINAESFKSIKDIVIRGSLATLNGKQMNLGSECKIKNGIYKVHSVQQCKSRNNKNTYLKNSLSISLLNI